MCIAWPAIHSLSCYFFIIAFVCSRVYKMTSKLESGDVLSD